MGNTPDAHETHAWVLHPDIKTDYSARAATDALAEAVSLAHALPGLEVMGETIVRLPRAHPGKLFGKGKIAGGCLQSNCKLATKIDWLLGGGFQKKKGGINFF